MIKKSKYKIVEVTWFDAQTSTQDYTLEELEAELIPILSKSAGYLISEKKDYIILGFLDFGDGLIKHHQVIPRGMVKKIRKLK